MNLNQKGNTVILLLFMITLLINIVSAAEQDFQQNDGKLSTTLPSRLDFAKLGKYKMSQIKLFDSNQDLLNSTEIERDDKDESVTDRPGPESRAGSFQRRERKMKHMENFTLTVEMDGKIFEIDLTINRFLLSANYTETLVNSTRRKKMNVDLFATHCYYLGTVRGYENSSAAVSTCNGITGAFFIGDESYYIEPDRKSEICLTCSHKIYKSSDQPPELKNLGCGTSDHHSVNPNFARRRKRAPITEWPQGLPGKTRIVEVFAISDHNQDDVKLKLAPGRASDLKKNLPHSQNFTKYSGDLTVISQRAKDIINTASLLYHSEDIYLVLVGLEVWADTDRVLITTPLNSSQLLDSFCTYSQKNVTQRRDITLYITSVGPFDMPTSVVGKAFLDRMCGENSCAFTADVSTTGQAGIVTAHEFGHVFGLIHDGETSSGRSCPLCDQTGGLCIMNPSVGSDSVKWSTCSKTILESSNTYNKFTCLNNLPSTLYDPTSLSKCGNGLVETGEQCDCGQAPTSECNPTCCNNVTCQLVAPAECAFGKCCNVGTCKFIAKYTECRSIAGVCDLSEYCSGSDHLCPSDVYKVDYSTCTSAGTAGYCLSGQCNNRQNQCQILFGTSASAADDDCYTFWNSQTQYPQYRYVGNCGYAIPGNYTVYVPCAPADIFCGQAQCNGGTLQFTDAYTSQGNITNTNVIVCNQAHFSVPISDGNRGYIQDGSPCGTGKVCQSQKCVDLTAVTSGGTCPNCSGNGVCNGLYQCHCNVGFAPPQCSQPGEGGSLHSGGIVPLPSTSTTTISTSTTSSTTLSTTSSTISTTTLPTSSSTTSTTLSTTLSTSSTISTTLSTTSSTVSTTLSTTLSTSSTISTTLSTTSSTISTTLSTSSSTISTTTLSTTSSTISTTSLSTTSSTISTTLSTISSTISTTTISTTTTVPSSSSSTTTLSSSTISPSTSSISTFSTTRTSTTTSPSSTSPTTISTSPSSISPSTTTSSSSASSSSTTSPTSSSPSSTKILPSSTSSTRSTSLSNPTSTSITPSSTSRSSTISISSTTLSSSTPASTGSSQTANQDFSSKTTPTKSGQSTSTHSINTETCTDTNCHTWVIIVSVILGTFGLLTVSYLCYRCYFRRAPKIRKPIQYDNPTPRSIPVRLVTRQPAGFDPFNPYQ